MRAQTFGWLAEIVVIVFLVIKGYKILAHRYRVQGGEIDIVAMKKETIVFVEVKARARLEDAQVAVTYQKIQRITKAAHVWMIQHPMGLEAMNLRIDTIFVAPWSLPHHITNAYSMEE